jgi:hypothetical protein
MRTAAPRGHTERRAHEARTEAHPLVSYVMLNEPFTHKPHKPHKPTKARVQKYQRISVTSTSRPKRQPASHLPSVSRNVPMVFTPSARLYSRC